MKLFSCLLLSPFLKILLLSRLRTLRLQFSQQHVATLGDHSKILEIALVALLWVLKNIQTFNSYPELTTKESL